MATKKITPPRTWKERGQRIKRTMSLLLANKQHWAQHDYHSDCGTSHCFAGFAQILARGLNPVKKCSLAGADAEARVWLGLNSREEDAMFDGDNTLDALKRLSKEFAAGPSLADHLET